MGAGRLVPTCGDCGDVRDLCMTRPLVVPGSSGPRVAGIMLERATRDLDRSNSIPSAREERGTVAGQALYHRVESPMVRRVGRGGR